jgi:hypothetical protein
MAMIDRTRALAMLGILPAEAWDFVFPHEPALVLDPEPCPWLPAAVELLQTAAIDRTIAFLAEGATKRDLMQAQAQRAESAIAWLAKSPGLNPNPDDPNEPHGPGTPVIRLASVLMQLAAAMPAGPTRAAVQVKAKTLI